MSNTENGYSPEVQAWQIDAHTFYNRVDAHFKPERQSVNDSLRVPSFLWGSLLSHTDYPAEWQKYLDTLDTAIATLTAWREHADTLTARIEAGIIEQEREEQRDIYRKEDANRQAKIIEDYKTRFQVGTIVRKSKNFNRGRSDWKVIGRDDEHGAFLERYSGNTRLIEYANFTSLQHEWRVIQSVEAVA